MDLGRMPLARFPDGELIVADTPVTEEDLARVTSHIGEFGGDNRAGIERTLHRISAIRNRRGKVIGLTCRVGRAVYGTVALIRDVIEQGRSLLILGRPGVGKTTMLREVARVLADDLGKRVVIVDTSNEIAGDGDVPHPGIGRARRMQVARPAEQHAVMIEAVENHMPEVIIIDEIGTELEAMAARTIAERGVQLVGTAHGNTLDNLLLNPTLSDLVGGISAVTLGDEEARRRGTQKTVLERKAPPTFDVVVEQQERTRILVHANVSEAVDTLLRGDAPMAELRTLHGEDVRRETVEATSERPELAAQERASRVSTRRNATPIHAVQASLPPVVPAGRLVAIPTAANASGHGRVHPRHLDGILRVFPFGINHDRVYEVVLSFGANALVVDMLDDADVILTHQSIYRQQGERLRVAEAMHLPIFILRNPGIKQMQQAFVQILGLTPVAEPESLAPVAARPIRRRAERDTTMAHAMQEAEDAIHVLLGDQATRGVELTPQEPHIRRMQHRMAERYNLQSRSYGKEPKRRVYIYSA